MSESMPPIDSAKTHRSSKSKATLEVPSSPATSRIHKPPNPLHLLPSTALFHGPHSRNDSRSSLSRQRDHDKTSASPNTGTRHQSQHLPRANPPTSSFSGPRGSYLTAGTPITPADKYTPSVLPPRPGLTTLASSRKQDDFRADAVWAEMQRTLADVELSAMNSSHVFGDVHARALEDLRAAQLGLAQAWAKSEADEMRDEEFGRNEGDRGDVVGAMKGGVFGDHGGHEHHHGPKKDHPKHPHSRNSSIASNVSAGDKLEEETERDIKLARRRREANDRYFRQVNRGVLDVVRKLDEVTTAMRRVEKESRDIWNESSGSEDLGDVTETDQSVATANQKTKSASVAKPKPDQQKATRARAATQESHFSMGTDTDALSASSALDSSPMSRRR